MRTCGSGLGSALGRRDVLDVEFCELATEEGEGGGEAIEFTNANWEGGSDRFQFFGPWSNYGQGFGGAHKGRVHLVKIFDRLISIFSSLTSFFIFIN